MFIYQDHMNINFHGNQTGDKLVNVTAKNILLTFQNVAFLENSKLIQDCTKENALEMIFSLMFYVRSYLLKYRSDNDTSPNPGAPFPLIWLVDNYSYKDRQGVSARVYVQL